MIKPEKDFFIDVGFCQKEKYPQEICGDVYLTRRISAENRTVAVLSDGLGSGVKANILASMTASMALNFTSMNSPLAHIADIIMQTLPIDRERKVSFSSFTIIDVEADGLVHLIEYGNPDLICLRQNEDIKRERSEIKIKNRYKLTEKMYYSQFKGLKEDRIIVFSDGITQSGMGTRVYPFGWSQKNVRNYLIEKVKSNSEIASEELSKSLLAKAIFNDANRAKDDITAGVIYLREPRRVMLCSGPPYNDSKDTMLAKNLDAFEGKKIISGGTTANIIARELKRKITTNITRISSGLPPASTIDNIDLVTEGILTIGKVLTMLEDGVRADMLKSDPASELCRMLIQNDEIHFVVGTRVNEAHQDPGLPVELEIRRNVIKKIAHTLEEKYLKKSIIEYI